MVTVVVTGCQVDQVLVSARATVEAAATVVRTVKRILQVRL